MSLSLHEQLKLHTEDPLEYDNIFPHDCWTLEEYKEFFRYIGNGWLVQSDENNGFVVNPEWEGEPSWSPSEDVSWFGTAYHDGSGFNDCDPTGSGNRKCYGLPKGQMCSECIYLQTEKQN
mgnify:FL=1|tara:strand:- start:36 stop:395 length:360 start_codon:yes stop_codon:yes gene_type:complete